MNEFLTALALMFAIEGLCFAAFPGLMQKAMQDAATTKESVLRLLGLAAATFGLALMWASRGFPMIEFSSRFLP